MTVKLTMRGISKAFGGNLALDNVDFTLRRGEIHTLMGENGAGKSTLMKVLIGLHHADNGTIEMDGRPIQIQNPREAAARGIAMIHQELYPILDMSVADNIFIGREIRKTGGGPLGLVDRRRTNERAQALLADMGLNVRPETSMRSLSVAETQLVEIIKAVSQGAEIIIMDEPTSAIADREAEQLFEHMFRLKKNGVAIVYISHKMDEIFKVSDRITVLRDGKLVGSKPASELNPEMLVRMMVGRELNDIYPKRAQKITSTDTALEVRNLSDGVKFENVSFALHRGEILGMAGLMGAGRTEVVECLFGLTPKTSGEVLVNGKAEDIRTPRDAIACKIALVSDDRKQKGLNLQATVGENISLLKLRSFSTLGLISKNREGSGIRDYMKRLNVKAQSPDSPVTSLSGGNQQKVVLAKWLLSEPEIVIFDEPTRGIDVGAKHEIYLLLNALADQGKAVLMISSEMSEIVGMSDRVIVMADGHIAGEVMGKDINQEAIMTLASDLQPVV